MTPPWRRRLAIRLVRAARWTLPRSREAWGEAMEHELAHVDDDRDALGWAAGCLKAGAIDRLRALRAAHAPGAGVSGWWDGLRFDLRHVIRSLAHARSFTGVAVLTFALGMGANIAVFSVFDTLLFRPLPYANPDRLVQIHTKVFGGPQNTTMAATSTFELDFALRQEASSLAGIAWDEGLTTATAPAPGDNPLFLTPVTPNVLDVLGVRPARGRGFEAADAVVNGGDTAVVLTHDAWRSRFGGSDDVLSRTWGEGDTRYRVVGVLPPGFFLPSSHFLERRDGLMVQRWKSPRNGLLTVAPVARLRDGFSIGAAQAELDMIARRHTWNTGIPDEPVNIAVQPLRAGLSILVGPYLWLTSWAVWLVLGVACVNLSTLLLMRGRSRERLGALRAALGASPARLLRLAFLEAAVLCVAGGAIGWLICVWTGRWILDVLPSTLRGFVVTPFDARIVGISLAVIGGSALLAGALPAVAARRVDILAILRGDSSGVHRRTPLGAGRLFLGLEAAFGVLVVVGAAVAVPAFMKFLLRPPGFDTRNLYTVDLGRYENDGLAADGRAERVRAVVDIIEGLPHVDRAAAALVPPYADTRDTDVWTSHGVTGSYRAIDAGMFQTIGAPMRAGREFSASDIAGAAPLAVVNEAGARALWPGAMFDAIVGRPIDVAGGTRTIVGVAGDVQTLPGAAVGPGVFLPITAREAKPLGWTFPVVVRMDAGMVPDQDLLTARLHERFPKDRVRVASIAAQFGKVLDRPRFLAVLFGVLAGIALLLVAIGVYAVAAFEAVNRRHEMAIRMALGASVRRLRGRLSSEILSPVLIGAATGIVAAWLGVRGFRAMIVELEAANLSIYLLAALFIVSVTLLAVWRPARNAARVDPASELRGS